MATHPGKKTITFALQKFNLANELEHYLTLKKESQILAKQPSTLPKDCQNSINQLNTHGTNKILSE